MKNWAIGLMILTSCSDNTEYSINPKLLGFVGKFYTEADKRGISLEKENLIVKLMDCDRSHSTKDGNQRVVVISIKDYLHNLEEGYMNEALVSHKLGHALLHLEHTKDISLMNYDYTYTSLFRNDCVKELYYNQLFLHSSLSDDLIWQTYLKCL